MKPVVYFGMSEEDYRAEPALSQSGIKVLNKSPFKFWAQKVGKEEKEPTAAQNYGHFFETALIEGIDQLDKRYAIPLVRAGYKIEDYIGGMGERREYCKKIGLKPGTSLASAKAAILADDPTAQFLDDLEARHLKDKEPISEEEYLEIERSLKIAEASGMQSFYQNGAAQVSVFFELELGPYKFPLKSRFDFLRFADGHPTVLDHKCFANSQNKEAARIWQDQIEYNRNGIQAYIYRQALKQIMEHGADVKGGNDFERGLIKDIHESGQDESKRARFIFTTTERGDFNECNAHEYLEHDADGQLNGYAERDLVDIQDAFRMHTFFEKNFGWEIPWGFNLRHGVPQMKDDQFAPYYIIRNDES